MLFWILLIGVPVLAILIGIAVTVLEGDGEEGVIASVASFFIGSIVSGFLLGILTQSGWDTMKYNTVDSTSQLQNIADSHAEQGAYVGGLFASYGYVDGVRKVNYVSKQHGYSTLESVDADEARIHEGSDSPRVVRHDYTYYDHALVPWDLGSSVDYDFYVPTGTISNSFAIGNGGD